jgi:hydroxyacylglutathione hydrolase
VTLLQVHVLQLRPIGTNCYVVHAADSTDAFVLELAEAEGLAIEAILVTHFHFDHIGGVAGLAAATGAPVWMSKDEAYGLERPEERPITFPGVPEVPAWPVEHNLTGGERITVAGVDLDVMLLPGHSPAHIAFLAEGVPDEMGELSADAEMPPIVFSGDVLFKGSVGRTDLPGSDQPTLVRSLQLMTRRLDPTTLVLSGHGEPTTMEAEIRTNPYLRGI